MIATILPHDVSSALNDAPAGCTVLSLDCFDTLLWRTTHAPTGVFADIGSDGGTSQQRRWAESHARSRSALHRQSNEATIAGIYDMLLPNACDAVRQKAVEAELAAEARHCFAFAPTVDLIREAKRRGLTVIVVSDTYLSAAQLGWLIGAAAGAEVRGLIDHIFCSSDMGVSKPGGLFTHVLKALRVKPGAIMHLGDNLAADGDAPARLGIAARHLAQFGADSQQRLRMEAAAGAVLHAGQREVAGYQTHRAAVALAEPGIADPAMRLGYAVLGPVLAGFDRWLRNEVLAIRASTSARIHLLFLMRDGHLPFEVHRAVGEIPGTRAARAEISRFTATASSFTDQAAIDRLLERELGAGDFEGIARQLLFTPAEAAAMLRRDPTCAAFLAQVRKRDAVATILARSAQLRGRLLRHVAAAIDPQPGDTIVLVDLGYGGTVQSCIEPLLREAFQVDVKGRYLLLREQEITGHDKRGLLDGRHYDLQTLNALCSNAAALEQLCTVAQGSVVDYRDDGAPVRSGSGIKARQSDVRDRVQQGCIRFACDGQQAMLRPPASLHAGAERETAAAVLARFMFLPQPGEVDVLRQFEHDINLGGGETVPLFDATAAERDLRREGMFYVKEAERMYVPAELQAHGLPLSLTLLTQRRFDLDLRRADFRGAGLTLPILVADGRQVSVSTIEANRTHDGFFAAVIPIGVSHYAIGVQFGQLYEWVEVQSAAFQPARSLVEDATRQGAHPSIAATPSFEAMEAASDHLMRCTDATAFMMVPPPPPTGEAMVLTIVFRPIVPRQPASPSIPRRTPAAAGACR